MSAPYSVSSLGRLRLRADWRIATLHPAPHSLLYWFTRGQGRVTVGATTRGYGPNTAVFVPQGTLLALELGPQVQGLQLGLPTDPAIGLPGRPFHIRVGGIEAQAALTGQIEQIEREMAHELPARDVALRGHGLLISAWILRQLSTQEGAILRERTHALAEKFIELMELRFRSGATVADFARQLGVTPTHLSRVCKEASGRPAHALLTERIMHEARRLLADTDLSAREIASHLGFSSPAYFTRAFSAHVGRTPSAFRKSPGRG